MEEYMIPLFIEEESKVFGPLSLFQFILMGIAAAIIIVLLLTTKNFLLVFGVFILIGVPAIYFAFGTINGEKSLKVLTLSLKFLFGPKVILWQKKGEETITLKEVTRVMEEKQKVEKRDFRESRLKQISWRLETGERY